MRHYYRNYYLQFEIWYIIGIGIVFNNIAAILWLDEKIIWKYDLPAFILIVGSSTAIVLLSAEEELEYTPEEINKHLKSTQAIVYCHMSF